MGPVPIKLSGRIPAQESDTRFAIEADLTQAKVDNLLPGWSKGRRPRGRATFTLVNKSPGHPLRGPGGRSARRFGQRARSRSMVPATCVSANFPSSACPTATRRRSRPDRKPDGTLRVIVRGDVYDGRGFIKSTMSGGGASNRKQSTTRISISTSSSARSSASTARRCAASI
jgi:hypothetical protein